MFEEPIYKSKEMRLCRNVMGLSEKEAIKLIERNECIAFVERRDKMIFSPHVPTGHSYRIKLTIKNGKVISTDIG